MDYFVYIVECADGTLYTGIATDVERRLVEHNGAMGKGARYTSPGALSRRYTRCAADRGPQRSRKNCASSD